MPDQPTPATTPRPGTATPIATQVTALQAELGSTLPPEAAEVFHVEQESLKKAGIPAQAAGLGTRLRADLPLLDPQGAATTLGAARSTEGPTVLVLYRGAWCPYCNVALRTYQQQLVPALEARGVPLLAVSPQRPDGSLSMRETHELTYTVLSDPGNGLARALGVLVEPAETSLSAQRSLGLDLKELNADGSTALPMPTVAILDAHGTVRWIDIHPDYTSRTEPEEILHALTRLA